MIIALGAVLGALAGPVLHHLAVSAGSRRPFGGRPDCLTCGEARRHGIFGRCGVCGSPPSRREWVATGASGVVVAGSLWVADDPWLMPAFAVFAAVTLILVITDLDHKLIPNRILYPGGALAMALLISGALAIGRADALPRTFAGGLGYFGVLFGVALIARGGFGFGDVKLAALLGAFTAFDSLQIFLVAIFFTGLAGGIPAIVLLATRRARPKDELPYGPAMVLGAWAALSFGEPFLRWYGA